MNDEKVKEIFIQLQGSPFNSINPKRKIRSYPKYSPLCCLFSANHENGYIEYDSKMLEFMDENAVRWCLLHEEGHMRYFLEKIDWENKPIIDTEIKSIEDNHQSEYNADMYSAKQFFEKIPDVKAYEVMESAVVAICYCNSIPFFCFLKKWIRKLFTAIRFKSLQSSYPKMSDRIKKTKNFYDEMILKNKEKFQ